MTKTLTKPLALIVLKGRDKSAREMAFVTIAPLAFLAETSRAALIAGLDKALTNAPSETEVKVAQQQACIGRIAARLPAGEFPAGVTDDVAKLAFAGDVLLRMARPADPDKKARKLLAGQIGRRSPVAHKVARAADQWWSLLAAELGFTAAQTQAEKVKKEKEAKESGKRAPHHNAQDGDKPDAGDAKKPNEPIAPEPMTADAYCAHIKAQARALAQFDKKHAKLRPIEYSEVADLLAKLHRACLTAENKRGESAAKARNAPEPKSA